MNEVMIVSVCPISIRETKPGVVPGEFSIAGAAIGDVEILAVPDGWYDVYIDHQRGYMRKDVPAQLLAESIINDFSRAQVAYSDTARPGFFIVNETATATKDYIKKKYEKEILACRRMQAEWFKILIKLADDDWNKYKQLRMISDLQRMAANTLSVKRDWNTDVAPDTNTNCISCQSVISSLAVVCPFCKVILKPEEHKKFTFAT